MFGMLQIVGEDESPPRLSAMRAEAEEMDLLVGLELQAQPCPYERGQLVMPHSMGYALNYGSPYVVVEVLPSPTLVWDNLYGSRGGSSTIGMRVDMRVGHMEDGTFVLRWVESWGFVPYVRPVDKAPAA